MATPRRKKQPKTEAWPAPQDPVPAAERMARYHAQQEDLNSSARPGAARCPVCRRQRPSAAFPARVHVNGKWVPNKTCNECLTAARGGSTSVRARPQGMPGKRQ